MTASTPWVVSKKMSRGRLLELLRGTLMDLGVDPVQAQVAGFNRLRRFLPTLGQICRLRPTDQQSLASWVEVPSAGGPTPQRKSRATWTTGVHYAGQKVVHSGLLKAALVQRFLHLWQQKQPSLALTHDGLLPRDSWSRQDLAVANEALPHVVDSLDLPAIDLTPEHMAQPVLLGRPRWTTFPHQQKKTLLCLFHRLPPLPQLLISQLPLLIWKVLMHQRTLAVRGSGLCRPRESI